MTREEAIEILMNKLDSKTGERTHSFLKTCEPMVIMEDQL